VAWHLVIFCFEEFECTSIFCMKIANYTYLAGEIPDHEDCQLVLSSSVSLKQIYRYTQILVRMQETEP
jgi:hypothetical protein